MKKSRLLFVIPGLSHGGTNKVLESLLPILDKDLFEIHIITLNAKTAEDVYFDRFSHLSFIHRLPECVSPFLFKLIGHPIFLVINRLLKKYLRCTIIQRVVFKKAAKSVESLLNPDLAIAFEENRPTMMVSYFNCAKIAWIQCDYETTYIKELFPVLKEEHKFYLKYSNIVCVSEYTTNSFLNVFNDMKDKVLHIDNPLSVDQILSLALEEIEDDIFKTDLFTIISVGRISREKQFHLIPQIVNKVAEINNELKFRWYIIGDGPEQLISSIESDINKLSLKDKVFLLGAKDNPYPYMKASDLYVCTSYSESFSYVIREAKVLGVPVVSNQFPSAIEALNDEDGVIVDIERFPQTIVDMIQDKEGCYRRINKKHYETNNIYIAKEVNNLFLAVINK